MKNWGFECFGRQRHLGPNVAPFCIQLLGHNHGNTRMRALTEIGLADPDRYRIVSSNFYDMYPWSADLTSKSANDTRIDGMRMFPVKGLIQRVTADLK